MLAFVALYLLTPVGLFHQAASAQVTSRPCGQGWNRTVAIRKKHSKKNAQESPSAAACIEISSSVLDVQEYLQAYVRKQEWKILDEELNEDFWDFSVAISTPQLLEYTTPDPESSKVAWRSGIANVQVSSTRLPDGFTRTIIRASFRGYGSSEDQFAVPRAYWKLASNGSFEASLISVLKAQFKGTA